MYAHYLAMLHSIAAHATVAQCQQRMQNKQQSTNPEPNQSIVKTYAEVRMPSMLASSLSSNAPYLDRYLPHETSSLAQRSNTNCMQIPLHLKTPVPCSAAVIGALQISLIFSRRVHLSSSPLPVPHSRTSI